MFHSDSAFATLTSQTLTHEQKLMNPVSYTHLTLPTICSV